MSYVEAPSNTVTILKASSTINSVTTNPYLFFWYWSDKLDAMVEMKIKQLSMYEIKYYRH